MSSVSTSLAFRVPGRPWSGGTDEDQLTTELLSRADSCSSVGWMLSAMLDAIIRHFNLWDTSRHPWPPVVSCGNL